MLKHPSGNMVLRAKILHQNVLKRQILKVPPRKRARGRIKSEFPLKFFTIN